MNPIDSTHFPCPHCSHDLAVTDSSIANQLRCERCHQMIDIPYPSPPNDSAKGDPISLGLEPGVDLEFSFECPICNSRLMARSSKISQITRCPDCHSEVVVPEPQKPKHNRRGNRSERTLSIGPVGDADLDDDNIPLLSLSDNESTSTIQLPMQIESAAHSLSQPSNKSACESNEPQLSRKERYDRALQRLREQKTKNTSWFSKPGKTKKGKSALDPRWKTDKADTSNVADDPTQSEQPTPPIDDSSQSNVFDHAAARGSQEGMPTNSEAERKVNDDAFVPALSNDFLNAAVQIWGQSAVVWRVAVAGLTLGLGSALMHKIATPYIEKELAKDVSIKDWLANTSQWYLVGTVYLVGLVVLWYLAGVIFRYTATGQTKIERWIPHGPHELKSTWLLFGFSFFIAGLPISPIPFFYILVTPLRFILAPPLLLAAWYHQDPFKIVAVDAFSQSKQHWRDWMQLYFSLLVLALVALVGGWLMTFPGPILPFFTSVVGALLIAAVTISFAAIVGWHCGYIVESLRDKDE